MDKKLSIITINFNNLSGLQRTVESVLKQTVKEFEYIIIDGGSTDGSAGYIESQSEHIDYWVSEPDNGIYNAMNKGILKANGEYLMFLNSGDWLFDETVLESFSKYNSVIEADVYYGNVMLVNPDSSFSEKLHPEKMTFYWLYKSGIYHCGSFISRKAFYDFGLYNENYKIVSDWIKFLEMLNSNRRFKKIDKCISFYTLGGVSSRDINTKSSERNLYLDLNFSYIIDDIRMYDKIKKVQRNFIIRVINKIFRNRYW